MRLCRLVPALLASVLPLVAQLPQPQTQLRAPQPRLHGFIREDTRSTLPGSRPNLSLQGQDLGPAPDAPVRTLTLVFSRSPEQQQQLDTLLAAQQDPASPLFHQWLTPELFGQRFGMADEDLALARQWLQAQGFTVGETTRARDRISFSGDIATINRAFGASLHSFLRDGETHLAPTAELSLPTGLASVTAAILHLDDTAPEPMARFSPQPDYTSQQTGAHFLTPADLAVEYDLPAENNNYTRASGQAIAIVGQSFVDLSFGSVVQEFTPNARHLTSVLVPGSGTEAVSPADAVESEIDVEYASGLAPSANIFLVHTGTAAGYSVWDALAFAIQQDLAPVISISYGLCEPIASPSFVTQSNALFQQAGVQGQSLIAAAGDAGSTACTRFATSSSLSSTTQQALAVSFPASSPFVTAVGGTQLPAASFAATNTTSWRSQSSGYDLPASLISFIPEIVWNEGSPTRGILAGGGGVSLLNARPAWQISLPNAPTGNTRLVPDIALQASVSSPGFLFCSDVVSRAGNSSCPYGYAYTASSYRTAGGTSFGAPTFAAMVATLNGDTQSLGQGNLNPTLYRLATSPSTAFAFHDVTSGSIACVPGAALCSAAGQSAFPASAGYDLATGLGSVDYTALAASWPAARSTRSSTSINLQPFNTSLSGGQQDLINITVGGSFAPNVTQVPPSGTITLLLDGLPAATLTLNPTPFGAYTSTSTTITAPASTGSHILFASYSGDSTHAPVTSVAAIQVGSSAPTGSIALSATDLVLPSNSTGSSTITVTPGSGYVGRLNWTLSLSGGSAPFSGCYSVSSALVRGSTPFTLTVGSGSACSASATAQVLAAPGQSAHLRQAPLPHVSRHVAALASLVCLLLPLAHRRRPLPLLALMLVVLPVLSGCGGGVSGSSASNTSGSPSSSSAGSTYTATVTARDSVNTTIVSSTTFSLITR